jgi:chromosome segregation ATPase
MTTNRNAYLIFGNERTPLLSSTQARSNGVGNINRYYSIVNNYEKKFRNTEKELRMKKNERNRLAKNLSILHQNVNSAKKRAVNGINAQAKPNINRLMNSIKKTNNNITNKEKSLKQMKNGSSEYKQAKRSISNIRKSTMKSPAAKYNRVPNRPSTQKRGVFGRMYNSAGSMYKKMRGQA